MAATQEDPNDGVKERDETPRIIAYSFREHDDTETSRGWLAQLRDDESYLDYQDEVSYVYRMELPSGRRESITKEDYEHFADIEGIEVTKSSFDSTNWDVPNHKVYSELARSVFFNGDISIEVGNFKVHSYTVKVDRSDEGDEPDWVSVGSVSKSVNGRNLVKPYKDQEIDDLIEDDEVEWCSIRLAFQELKLTDEEFEEFGSEVIPALVRTASMNTLVQWCRLVKCFETTEDKVVCPRI